MRENVIEKFLVKRVKQYGGEIRKVKWVGRRGAPDRLVWIPDWKYPKMVELKAPGKKLEKHQQREHRRLKHMGMECVKLDTPYQVNEFLLYRPK